MLISQSQEISGNKHMSLNRPPRDESPDMIMDGGGMDILKTTEDL